jgi:hypothetical protein
MADGGRMKGVEGAARGAGDDGEEAREDPGLALSLGRQAWHLPARQEPAPRSLNWTAVLSEWNPDAAGTSRAAARSSCGQPTGGSWDAVWVDEDDVDEDMLGGIIPGSGGSGEAVWMDEDDVDEFRDMQNKRLRVRGFGE